MVHSLFLEHPVDLHLSFYLSLLNWIYDMSVVTFFTYSFSAENLQDARESFYERRYKYFLISSTT